MLILDPTKCSGATRENVLLANGGSNISVFKDEKGILIRKVEQDRLHAGSVLPLIGSMLAPWDPLSAPIRVQVHPWRINVHKSRAKMRSLKGSWCQKRTTRGDQGAMGEETGDRNSSCAPSWRAGNVDFEPQMQWDDLQKCASRRGREALFSF